VSANKVYQHPSGGALYVGSHPPFSVSGTVLVLCAEELQPEDERFPCIQQILRARLRDDGSPMAPGARTEAKATAALVADLVARGRRVLCTCAAGRNRSGLVAALALVAMPPSGFSASEAIDMVRTARAPRGALVNEEFVRLIQQTYAKKRAGLSMTLLRSV
jgi:protein-tyrosine phosphatase